MSTRSLSLRWRATLAIALLVGFYLLAISILLFLLYIPVAEISVAHRLDGRLAVFCLVGAWAIAKGVMPRRDRFEPPGPALLPDRHPRVFGEVSAVAAATRQAMPEEVYLVPDVNAFVMERGGVMGIGSRRVMGVGLPLLAALDVAQFRAVVAHEFGHYEGGDTRLGPWVYRTRAALGRTLAEVSRHSSIVAKPFEWYGKGFLRITHAVSRRQEFVADAVAARIAGAATAAEALRNIQRAAAGFTAFWSNELAPVLEHGYRPPLSAGFQQFLGAPDISQQLDGFLASELESGKSNPYDTHPSLRERVSALETLRDVSAIATPLSSGKDVPALALLEDVPALEAELMRAIGAERKAPLAPVSWDAVPATVLPLGWTQMIEDSRRALASIRTRDLPSLAQLTVDEPQAVADRLGLRMPSPVTVQQLEARAAIADAIVGAALSLLLVQRARETPGAIRLHAPPGEPVVFALIGDGPEPTAVLPFYTMTSLRRGSTSPEEWVAHCAALGILDVPLAETHGAEMLPDGSVKRKQPWR